MATKLLIAVVLTLSLVNSDATVLSAEPSLVMRKMGYSGFRAVSPQQARGVRGKGFFVGGSMQQQAVLAAGVMDYKHLQLSIQKAVRLTRTHEFDLHLQDFRQQLGPEFDAIDLSSVKLRVSQVVDYAETFDFHVNYTSLSGTDLIFGPALRVTGGIFP